MITLFFAELFMLIGELFFSARKKRKEKKLRAEAKAKHDADIAALKAKYANGMKIHDIPYRGKYNDIY